MEKVFLNKEGVQVYPPPKYPDMDGPGTEYAAGSKEDLAYARGYEDAEADMIAKQSKGQQVNKNGSQAYRSFGIRVESAIRSSAIVRTH